MARLQAVLDHVCAYGGVFHLWGHSWELEAFDGWGSSSGSSRMPPSVYPGRPPDQSPDGANRRGRRRSSPSDFASRPAVTSAATEKLRVLVAHNAYQQPGGEDAAVEAEVSLLRGRGHAVEVYLRHNDELRDMGSLAAAKGYRMVGAIGDRARRV